MSLADQVIYALEATPEQAAELRQLTGEALTAKMREVMQANGLSLIEVQRRLYSIDSLWAGQQDTRQRRTGLGTVASPVGSRGTASQSPGHEPDRPLPPGPATEADADRAHRSRYRLGRRSGLEVFLANAREIGSRKRAICVRHGLIGVFPADEEEACDPAMPLAEQGLAISRAMEQVMQGCDAMIVNLTPFRGPSADVGSAYEMGFMRALGRSIFAYTNDARPFLDRVAGFCGGAVRVRPTGEHEDPDGMAIEPFELHDNLMLAGGVIASGGYIIAEAISHAERYTSLAAFERCVVHAAAELLRRAASTQV